MLEVPDRSARVRVATSAPVNHFSSSAWISDTSESETNTRFLGYQVRSKQPSEQPRFYRPQMKFAKVMFSQVSVCPRRGGVSWQGGMRYGGQGGMHGRGHAWQERWPLRWTVRILLQGIVVVVFVVFIIDIC